MTDAPLGPSWWQASDGKWYPPQPPAPTGGPIGPYGPYGPYRGYPPLQPSRSNPLALAAMICAAVGLLVAFVPFMFWLAAVLGLTGVGLGIAGMARTRSPQPVPNRNLAMAGTALGGLAVIAAVVSFYVWTRIVEDAFDEFADDLGSDFGSDFGTSGLVADELDYDISIDACEVTGGQARAMGTVTNSSYDTTGFRLLLVFWDSEGKWQASGYGTVFDLEPDESGSFTVLADVSSEHVDCEITAVYYY